MNAISFIDGSFTDEFFPFSLTRSIADIRCGILTIREKWGHYLKDIPTLPAGFSISANIIPDQALIQSLSLKNGEYSFQTSKRLLNLTDILRYNETEIKNDFLLITAGRISQPISPTNRVTGSAIFLESGAVAEHCYLNANEGPIYIGKEATIL